MDCIHKGKQGNQRRKESDCICYRKLVPMKERKLAEIAFKRSTVENIEIYVLSKEEIEEEVKRSKGNT